MRPGSGIACISLTLQQFITIHYLPMNGRFPYHACLHVEKMENVTDRRPFRTGACVQSGWGGPWHLRRHNQSPTGALVAASRRPAGIPPGPDAAASPLDIPGGWDPRTNQQPTGLLIALPAAVPCCSNPSGS